MAEPLGPPTPWNADRRPRRGTTGSDRSLLASLRRLVRSRRCAAEARVFVLGTVGAHTVTERLRAILNRRGHAARAVTVDGDGPAHRGSDERDSIERDTVERGTTERGTIALDTTGRGAVETLVVDVHGGGEVLDRARDALGPPDVVVVTAAGRDGVVAGTPERGDVVRAIAGAVPADAHVVNAEGALAARRYLATAVERRGATISHVGAHDADAPGAELGTAIDGALAALEEAPMPDEEREALATAAEPAWLDLPAGRCYDALGVTDAVALERLRRALSADREAIELVGVTARDRRDVAATLADYASECHDRRAISTVHVVGPLAAQFARRCTAPAIEHGTDAPGGRVLDEALAGGPALLAGVAETPAGTAIADAITQRIERSGPPKIG